MWIRQIQCSKHWELDVFINDVRVENYLSTFNNKKLSLVFGEKLNGKLFIKRLPNVNDIYIPKCQDNYFYENVLDAFAEVLQNYYYDNPIPIGDESSADVIQVMSGVPATFKPKVESIDFNDGIFRKPSSFLYLRGINTESVTSDKAPVFFRSDNFNDLIFNFLYSLKVDPTKDHLVSKSQIFSNGWSLLNVEEEGFDKIPSSIKSFSLSRIEIYRYLFNHRTIRPEDSFFY